VKTIAILGPTASGKTALSIELAQKYGASILSLDSLSIYREIDIASAKPTLQERSGIAHFGIDVLSPSEHFDVTMFFKLYTHAKEEADKEHRHLIIVGGTGFYLKSMMEGLSTKPEITLHVKEEILLKLAHLEACYALIQESDPLFADKIAPSDRYRIEKWLEIFLSTGEIPSLYLERTKAIPLLGNTPLFEIDTPKEILASRVALRTHTMIRLGLLDEVFGLEQTYSRTPQCMKAIGIKEVLDYFDGVHSLQSLEEKITINTLHLAKRQRTFNASQFPSHPKYEVSLLKPLIEKELKEF
jgi:tRNA dimethylallyltransferase